LYARQSKCEFWLKQVAFFSHVMSKGGIFVYPSKIRDVLSWNAHASVTDIQSFLGLVGYYCTLIKEFSKMTKPMAELHGKDKKFKWMPTCEASF
jgi:hypothetical protein